MSVWYAVPSIRPNGGTIPLWRERGYNVAVLRQGEVIEAEVLMPTDNYLGWAPSVNILSRFILEHDAQMEFVVTGGDDYEPDMSHSPDELADQIKAHFGGTFGVCQFTGDRWGDDPASRAQYGENRGAYIDRIAGSPWMGREWCKRAYQGNGPMFGGYKHMYADEELKEVAEKLGVYWARRDLIQLHRHWGRRPGAEFASMLDCPDFLQPVNTPQHWHESKKLFDERKAAGWPGSEPLAL